MAVDMIVKMDAVNAKRQRVKQYSGSMNVHSANTSANPSHSRLLVLDDHAVPKNMPPHTPPQTIADNIYLQHPSSCLRPEIPSTQPSKKIQTAIPPNVLSPFSMFPSRILPLPGVEPTKMDESDGDGSSEFQIGDNVRVRRFNSHSRTWSPPLVGVVRARVVTRGYLGSYAKAFLVDVRLPGYNSGISQETFAPFLGEICPVDGGFPRHSASKCWELRQRLDWVYALIPMDVSPHDSKKESTMLIWHPSSVVAPLDNGSFRVTVLSGALKGQMFEVDCVHPYNDSTSTALRLHGQSVLDESGKMLKPLRYPKADSPCSDASQ